MVDAPDSARRGRSLRNLLFVWENFDTQPQFEQLKAHDPASALVIVNPQWLLQTRQTPPGVRIPSVRAWFYTRSARLFYALYPFYLVESILRTFFAFAWLRLARRVRLVNVIVINPYQGSGLVVMRRLGLIRNLIYIGGDWFANTSERRGIWSRLGQRAVHPWFDRWMVSNADCTIDMSENVSRCRDAHWGKALARRQRVMKTSASWLATGSEDAAGRRTWLFLGLVRPDSGVDLLLEALALPESAGARLRLIGPASEERERLLGAARARGLGPRIDVYGFTERREFPDLTRDCLFGANLITRGGSYTTNSIPAKVFDYMQFGLPSLCTEHVGAVAQTILASRTGLVIPATPLDVCRAAREIEADFAAWRRSIRAHIELQREATLVHELI